MQTQENQLRQQLGIPADAKQVLLFAESTHWDPNWIRSSTEYYQGQVEPGLLQVIEELHADPRRVYSIECMFFLRMFWEGHAEHHDALRELLNTRRIRLTGSGVTTPDTLLPSSEAILRDFLIGQEWLRSVGVTQEPEVMYFPDCFGHSPALPALLNASGFTRTAVTRIDGMWFMSADLDLPSNFPKKGSSAEHLLKQAKTLDFTWRSPDGSQVLCHWNAFTYGQGDQLADAGFARIYLYPQLSKPDRSDKTVNKRVQAFVNQLAPLSRTPYLFCPIGWDFNPPIPALNELLDRYNRSVYPSSGIWLVNAAMDDYFNLIECYQERLPVLDFDPTPYWTGFYTSRPALKQRAFQLVERLSLAEMQSVKTQQPSLAPEGVGSAWWSAAVANHHDLITGTSPDRIVLEEQIPWLDEALSEADRVVKAGSAAPAPAPQVGIALPACVEKNGSVQIQTDWYEIELSPRQGGVIEQLRTPDGAMMLQGPGYEVVRYNESGGLWRMGYEYRGGRYKFAETRHETIKFETSTQDRYLRVQWQVDGFGEPLIKTLWFSREDERVYFEVEGLAPQKSTLVMQMPLAFQPRVLRMEAPGGVVTRPLAKVYARPYWPVQRFIYVPNADGERGFAMYLRHPGAALCTADGWFRVVTQRNAIHEKAYFDLFSLLGMPATGIERERTTFRGAFHFPRSSQEDGLPEQARSLVEGPWASQEDRLLAQAARELVEIEGNAAFVTAIKPAWRGGGIILRLEIPSAPVQPVRLRLKEIPARRAILCDVRERDLAGLDLRGNELVLPGARSIVTVRLLP